MVGVGDLCHVFIGINENSLLPRVFPCNKGVKKLSYDYFFNF